MMSDQIREFVVMTMSTELLKFCRAHDLPFESADELMHRIGLSEYEYGWLNAYVNIWDVLIDQGERE
jgi:CMP-2-keto-3-deoxyoctulosonic acid synthetase